MIGRRIDTLNPVANQISIITAPITDILRPTNHTAAIITGISSITQITPMEIPGVLTVTKKAILLEIVLSNDTDRGVTFATKRAMFSGIVPPQTTAHHIHIAVHHRMYPVHVPMARCTQISIGTIIITDGTTHTVVGMDTVDMDMVILMDHDLITINALGLAVH